ncbi:MAG: DUF4838 domain-containing protein [Bacteroidetes bacterium]|nr:DUF4838 domain-containing protein [Bacteroidota bacterium]
MKTSWLSFIFLAFIHFGNAQTASVQIASQKVNANRFQIVTPLNPSPAELKAANELQKYLEKISGIRISITDDQEKMRTCEFVIGRSTRVPESIDLRNMDPDGFVIKNFGTRVILAGGSHKGTLYAVYTFLEKYMGCRFYAPDAETIPVQKNIRLPELNYSGHPAFKDREVYYTVMEDPDFLDKSRCDLMAWGNSRNWGLWVHTMFRLLPPEQYFTSHPEYYALFGGERRKTQLCLSNPDVLKITIDTLKKLMQDNPDAKYWSVSQMDTYGHCECPECTAMDQREGSPSGSYLEFVNKLAAAFPDKVISTLAYQFTRKPPLHVKPASNVNIMLCTIECDRRRPIENDTSAGSFLRDLQGWSRIASDILIWDYVIQFTNMIAPFPNFNVLQPNLQMFRKYGAGRIFEQGCHRTYSDSQELRAYLLSRLEWNPGFDVDSLIADFTAGYYGKAGSFMRKYFRDINQAASAAGQPLWIYSSPQQETTTFLSQEMVKKFNSYFDQAEKAVQGDSALTARVRKARLPLRYAILEIAKKDILGPSGFLELKNGKYRTRQETVQQLNTFVKQANLYGVRSVTESGLSVDDYASETNRFFKVAFTRHLAVGKSYSTTSMPASKYSADGPGSLTDGKRGTTNYYVLWQGWEGEDFEAVVDLGQPAEFNYVSAEFMQDLNSWIFYPEHVVISVSADGIAYSDTAVFDKPVDQSKKLFIEEAGKKISMTTARYVKFYARSLKTCPEWHIGHGGKSWIFVDELIVDKR